MTDSTPVQAPAQAARRTLAHRLAGWSLGSTLALALAMPALAQLRVPGAASPRPVSPSAPSTPAEPGRSGDFIVAIVNQELVTAAEVDQRITRVREAAARNGTSSSLPPAAELRQQVVDTLIDERVQITHARDVGQKIDEAELDRAVANVAQQNQVTMAQLRQRLAADRIDYGQFRNNLRDQMQVERVREREVQALIRISDADIESLLEKQRSAGGGGTEYNIAQILVSVPEGASVTEVAARKARIDEALARVNRGEAFEAVAREVSEDANKAAGGVIGLRPADRLPDVFVAAVAPLSVGQVTPVALRTGAGFHLLKLAEKRELGAFAITQTRARHILLRPSAQLSQEAAMARLEDMKKQISGGASFERLARDNSEDGSASQGGELGWVSPGAFVPEFEEAMNALAIGGLSDPVVSRFGVHLIQVLERRRTSLDSRQQREQARNVLREQKFDAAYTDWLRELRARSYIEMREAPT